MGQSATPSPISGEKRWGLRPGSRLFTKRSEEMMERRSHHVMGTSKGCVKNGPLKQQGCTQRVSACLQPPSKGGYIKAQMHNIF